MQQRLFDGGLVKLGSIFGSKVINILVDYTTKMDKILKEMKIFMTCLDLGPIPQSTFLKKFLDLSLDTKILNLFLDQLMAEAQQTLSTPTKPISKNPKTFRLNKPAEPASDACFRPETIVENALEAAREEL